MRVVCLKATVNEMFSSPLISTNNNYNNMEFLLEKNELRMSSMSVYNLETIGGTTGSTNKTI